MDHFCTAFLTKFGSLLLCTFHRVHKKTQYERRAERVEVLAGKLELSRTAVIGDDKAEVLTATSSSEKGLVPFVDPDPFQEFTFTSLVMAKHAIADYLGIPLAKLPAEQIGSIEGLLGQTMNKREIMAWVRHHLKNVARR